MVDFRITGDALWERMNRAVDKIQDRLERATRALEASEIPYAIVGGNAVRAWVAQMDEAAVRTTRDVDILLRRADLPAAIAAMKSAGFIYRHVKSIDMFLDGIDAKPRDAVHIVFAGERVKDSDPVTAPDVDDAVDVAHHRTLSLEALVRMKLTAFRDKDRVHLRDMLDVELIDESWVPRFPSPLCNRLQELIDNPE